MKLSLFTFLAGLLMTHLPVPVYCFCMSPESVIDAIHLGVHTSGDSDSIASLAGALVGAHCGIDQVRAYIPRIEDGDVAMQLAHTIAT